MANIQYYDVILKPVVTEKSMELMADKNREEYHNSCTLHVRKALQCRLACITACRSQNHNLLLQAVLFRRSFHQIGQYRKCHILKCQCSPVE